MAYGQSMRQRVLDAYDAGHRTRAIALRFDVSESWCRRVKQYRYEPPRKMGGGHFKLDGAGCAVLAGFVSQKPDATLEELRLGIASEPGISISIGALWNTLRRMKLSLKKIPDRTRADPPGRCRGARGVLRQATGRRAAEGRGRVGRELRGDELHPAAWTLPTHAAAGRAGRLPSGLPAALFPGLLTDREHLVQG